MNRWLARSSQVGLVVIACAATWSSSACQSAHGGGDLPDHLGVDGASARPRGVYRVVDDGSSTASPTEDKLTKPGPAPHRTIYLNRKGGAWAKGDDDSTTHHSSLVDGVVTIPKYDKGDASWASLVSCVKDQFARFDVDVTDVDPGKAPHLEAVFGGTPAHIGMSSDVGGVSPIRSDCALIEKSVVFVFSAHVKDAEAECAIAAQELAHSAGLDHELLCADTMSSLAGCGPKSFQDEAAACGESAARPCLCGGDSQNSVQLLGARFGFKGGPPPPTPDDGGAPTPPDDDGGAPLPPDDGGAPPPPADDGGVAPPPPTPGPPATGVSIVLGAPADGATLPANTTIDLVATVTDDQPLKAVVARWTIAGKTTELDCASPPMEVTCSNVGGTYTWHVPVGSGPRWWGVRAVDVLNRGQRTVDRALTLATGGGGPTPPPGPPPSPPPPPPPPPAGGALSIDQPVEGASVHAGDSVPLRVTVPSGVGAVWLRWQSPSGDTVNPLKHLSGTTWGLEIDVSSGAPAGTRTLVVSAFDAAGTKTVAPDRHVQIVP